MIQPDKSGHDIAPPPDDGLMGHVAIFCRDLVGGMCGQPFPYGILLDSVADNASIDRIDLVLDRFKRLSGEFRPDDP